ncbi:MAG: hypothetical protein ACREJN_18900 [Nitrospiraceae bacterium]
MTMPVGSLSGEKPPRLVVLRERDFAYILESESKRSERSGHLYQILLVYRTNAQGAVMMMEPGIAKMVIATLSMSLRDTDSIGWYREGCILGGVLTVLRRDSVADGCSRVRPRLVEILQDQLGVEESRCFQIRVCQPHELKAVDLVISSLK